MRSKKAWIRLIEIIAILPVTVLGVLGLVFGSGLLYSAIKSGFHIIPTTGAFVFLTAAIAVASLWVAVLSPDRWVEAGRGWHLLVVCGLIIGSCHSVLYSYDVGDFISDPIYHVIVYLIPLGIAIRHLWRIARILVRGTASGTAKSADPHRHPPMIAGVMAIAVVLLIGIGAFIVLSISLGGNDDRAAGGNSVECYSVTKKGDTIEFCFPMAWVMSDNIKQGEAKYIHLIIDEEYLRFSTEPIWIFIRHRDNEWDALAKYIVEQRIIPEGLPIRRLGGEWPSSIKAYHYRGFTGEWDAVFFKDEVTGQYTEISCSFEKSCLAQTSYKGNFSIDYVFFRPFDPKNIVDFALKANKFITKAIEKEFYDD